MEACEGHQFTDIAENLTYIRLPTPFEKQAPSLADSEHSQRRKQEHAQEPDRKSRGCAAFPVFSGVCTAFILRPGHRLVLVIYVPVGFIFIHRRLGIARRDFYRNPALAGQIDFCPGVCLAVFYPCTVFLSVFAERVPGDYIACDIARGDAIHAEHQRRCSGKVYAVPFMLFKQEILCEIFIFRKMPYAQVVCGIFVQVAYDKIAQIQKILGLVGVT